ncbi:SHOCT domain-containing protein [Mesobaculum littorinae]|uniref:SHOCT domain-containing protein n=1 Tax=Mesobaculum littorinae TaxID=2486419 RepID=A0A438AHA1_9RHOB|nr:SHOCT domain-containing protein [Mesobaculum littorinae]RVV98076.1 SHOCT domain-containing protein [Mesobaculum littorinae]
MLTDKGRRAVDDLAQRHDISRGAIEHLLRALAAGQGRQAQFNHPDLGGMGQWSDGGMLMIGDMFNSDLKARVDAVIRDAAALVREGGLEVSEPKGRGAGTAWGGALFERSEFERAGGGDWWPPDLGRPSSSGSQNAMRYAVFPGRRRLAIERNGRTELYDTGDHDIGGVSQAQSGAQTLSFSSQHGTVRAEDLTRVDGGDPARAQGVPHGATQTPMTEDRSPPTPPPVAPPARVHDADDVIAQIERLGALAERGLLSREEFEKKKAELLARL